MSEEQNRRREPEPARDTTDPASTDPQRTTNLPEADLPGTIGVYERPTGLRRFPAWLIILVLVIVAILAYLVFSFVV